jgi:hypothetical protein
MTEDREEGEEGRSETMGCRRSEATDGRRAIHNFLSKVTHLNTIPVQVGLNLRFS